MNPDNPGRQERNCTCKGTGKGTEFIEIQHYYETVLLMDNKHSLSDGLILSWLTMGYAFSKRTLQFARTQ